MLLEIGFVWYFRCSVAVHGRGRWNSARSALQASPRSSLAAPLSIGASHLWQSYSYTRLVRSVGFYGSDRLTVLETSRKPLIPRWFYEIGFVW